MRAAILTVAGNVGFGAMIWVWYQCTGGDMSRFIPGLVLASIALFFGLTLGVIGSQARRRKVSKPKRTFASAPATSEGAFAEIVE